MPLARRQSLLLALLALLFLAVPNGPAFATQGARGVRPFATAAATLQAPAKGVVGFGDQSSRPRAGKVLYDSRLSTPLAARETRVLDVLTAAGPVPAGARAVVLTVTAVDMRASGWLAVWGGGVTRPPASTLNFAPGTPVPNTAVVTLGTSRLLRVMNGSAARTQVLLSFQGYVLEDGTEVRPGSFRPTAGTRIFDSRSASAPIPAKGYRDIRVTGGAVPTGAAAVALDLVAVKPTKAGYLIAHAPGTVRPATTTLTYKVGADRAALTMAQLSSSGTVRVWNMSGAPVHLVADSFGWVAGGAGPTTLAGVQVEAPTRVLDTRSAAAGPLRGNGVRALPRTPASASGALVSVTVTGGTRAGYLRYGVPTDPSVWSGSFLNFAAGETVTSTVFVPFAPQPATDVAIQAVTSGTVHVIVDRLAVVAARAEVTGTVRDADTGGSVANALASADGPTLYQPTGPDGTFRVVPAAPQSVQVCAGTGTWDGQKLSDDGRYVNDCVGGTTGTAPRLDVPLGARLVGADISLTPTGVLTGQVVGPEGKPDVFGEVTIERLDAPMSPRHAQFGSVTGRSDGSWRAVVPPGTYIVWTNWGSREQNPGPYLANEVAMGLTRIPRTVEKPTTATELVNAGATTFSVPPTQTVTVPALTLLEPGRIDPTVVDPDGDLSDVSIDYVHADSGFHVWGYPVGSPASSLGASIPLRPGRYTVCVTEGATRVCNGGSSSPAGATPIQVVSGQTGQVTLTLP